MLFTDKKTIFANVNFRTQSWVLVIMLMTYMVIRKINGATREDSSIFYIYSSFATWFKYGLRATAPFRSVCRKSHLT